MAAVTPLDRMLSETDSRYMTPVPHRGERNDSAYVRLVAEKLAEWRAFPWSSWPAPHWKTASVCSAYPNKESA